MPGDLISMKVSAADAEGVVGDRAAAEGYIAKICFKTGPPKRVGVELEWIVYHLDDPTRPLDAAMLAAALGDHAPPTLHPASPHLPLPGGGTVTVEPGGQVEISTLAADSLADLFGDTTADIRFLGDRLAAAGLRLGEHGIDAYRTPVRLLDTARYAAMERAYDRIGPHGRTMMCATAGLQVCLDIGAPDRVDARWQALHTLGPMLLAMFANSARLAGRDTGWASSRMRAWYGVAPPPTAPSAAAADPIAAYARRMLDTPLLCLRNDIGSWDAPPDVTFADWIDGALPTPPTYDDLRYHLSTVFPPVRARGDYFEVRYLDTQPGDGWLLPAAVLAALFAREDTIDAAVDLAAPAADRWVQAARDGLSDAVIAAAAPNLADLACHALHDTDLSSASVAEISTRLHECVKTCRTGSLS